MPKLSPIRARDLIKVLEKKGFFAVRQEGSHLRLSSNDNKKVTVPVHSGEKVGRGLLRKILKDANISWEEFEKLK